MKKDSEKISKKSVKGRNGGTLNPGYNGQKITGRPKKIPPLEDLLNENMTEIKDGLMAADLVIKKLRQKAVQGDMKAIQYLLDRMYGKPKETLEHKGEIKTEAVRIIGSKEWIAQMKADGYSNEEIIKVIESA
jgi:hypothetical protein